MSRLGIRGQSSNAHSSDSGLLTDDQGQIASQCLSGTPAGLSHAACDPALLFWAFTRSESDLSCVAVIHI